jgi:hypothetical protein
MNLTVSRAILVAVMTMAFAVIESAQAQSAKGFTPGEIATGSCWIDAKTGARTPTGPVGWDPAGVAANPYVSIPMPITSLIPGQARRLSNFQTAAGQTRPLAAEFQLALLVGILRGARPILTSAFPMPITSSIPGQARLSSAFPVRRRPKTQTRQAARREIMASRRRRFLLSAHQLTDKPAATAVRRRLIV